MDILKMSNFEKWKWILFCVNIKINPIIINPTKENLIVLNGENLSSNLPPTNAPMAAEIFIKMAKYKISI